MKEGTQLAKRTPKKTTRQTVDKQVRFLRKIAKDHAEEFSKLLPKALSHRSPKIRGTAILLVTEHRITSALRLIEPLLHDRNEGVRYDAAECIGILQRGRGLSPSGLRGLLKDRSALVRIQALDSLGLVRDKSALPNIIRLLSDQDNLVRAHAASAVGILGGRSYLNQLRRGLSLERDESARIGFYEALFSLGEREMLGYLLMLLKSSDYRVRCAAANSLDVMPLRKTETQTAITALKAANSKSLALADRTTVERVLKALQG
jgi:HEAT repeat protein